MSLHPHHQSDLEQAEGLQSAIADLQASTKEQLESRRFSNRSELNCGAELLPGNVSDRNGLSFQGKCRDVSNRGCRLVLTKPLVVGDIYLIKIDSPSFKGDLVFGRCIRCHMLREDTFECGLHFLSPVSLETVQSSETLLDLG